MKVALGLILIAISFIYLIKNPSQSMMDGLNKKRKKAAEQQEQAQMSQIAATEETAQNPAKEDGCHCNDKE